MGISKYIVKKRSTQGELITEENELEAKKHRTKYIQTIWSSSKDSEGKCDKVLDGRLEYNKK